MKRKRLLVLSMVLILSLVLPLAVHAAAVGRLVQVEGQVDLLRQGKVPAVPAKVDDGLERGDVIRTKSNSKAQVRFVDDSVITLAPETSLSVAEFAYEPASNTRKALIRFFRGMVHLVVSRHLQVERPDFLLETTTAIIGVRGTEAYSIRKVQSTLAYLIKGRLEVKSSDPRLPAVVMLEAMQSAEVLLGQQARFVGPITPADLEMLKNLMRTGVAQSSALHPSKSGALGVGEGLPSSRFLETPGSGPLAVPPSAGAGALPRPVIPTPAPTPAPAPSSPPSGGSGSFTPGPTP